MTMVFLLALIGAQVPTDDVTRGRYEAGVGLGVLAGPIIGAPDIFLAGPALTASIRIGGSLFLTFDAAVAPVSGRAGSRGVSPGLPGGPMARAAFGSGWHFDMGEDISISGELAAFAGMTIVRGSDTEGSAFVLGLSPATTIVWALSEHVALAARFHLDWSPLTGRSGHLMAGFGLEPTFRSCGKISWRRISGQRGRSV